MSAHFVSVPALLLALGLAVPAAHAQTPAPADTARFYKHHLGLTASPVLEGFFRNNRSLPVGLLYKRQTRPNRATRYGVVGSHQYDSRTDNNFPPSNDNRAYTYYSVDAYVGREYSRALSRRWTGAAGVDVGVGFARSVFETRTLRNANPLVANTDERLRYNYYSAQVRPFAAVRYHLRPWLYASAETAFQVYYQQAESTSSITVTSTTGEVYPGIRDGNITDRTWRTQLQLIRQLTLHYSFPNP